jgi:hypothetical protein
MPRRIVLGIGTGHCGFELLVEILNRQPGTRVTCEEAPWLAWHGEPGAPSLPERLQRLLRDRPEAVTGDVASFYLPHLEQTLAKFPDLRVIGLRAPCEQVVEGFCRALDESSPYPTTHWSRQPPPGWTTDPFRSYLYPQYDVTGRAEGIRRYWEDYERLAGDLADRFPGQVRIWEASALTADAGIREVLGFAGFPSDEQVLVTGRPESPPPAGNAPSTGAPQSEPRLPAAGRCVVLVPFSGSIHPECERSLHQLEQRGYEVRRIGGYAAIDQARNQMASDALRDGFAETLWIDSDIGFHPDAIERLRSHALPIVCGIYPQKGPRALACHVVPGTSSMTFGKHGGLTELLYAGTGFLLVRREVYVTMQQRLRLPICNELFGSPLLPFFQPLIRTLDDGHWYLAEDYAFCHRARMCGYSIFADTTIRLWHFGNYGYSWENSGIDHERFATFTLHLGDPPGPQTGPAPPAPPAPLS